MQREAIVQVENLRAEFDGRVILEEVSFTAFQNEITVILGTSGCGKTTVLKHIIGLYPVQQGSVRVFGRPLPQLDEPDAVPFFLQMGVLFQNGALLNSLTVAENVAIPLEQHTDLPKSVIQEIVGIKLALVGLSHAGDLYPEQLSGGMRKRAALARAMAMDPLLLLCDEPSAGLDPVTLSALDELILNLKHQLGMSILLITHEVPSILRLADRIVFLEKGRVLFEGSLKEAFSANLPEIDQFFTKATGKSF